MSDTHAAHVEASYRSYWIAWAILLVLTLVMISISTKAFLIGGILLKSVIIGAWFMHLKHERAILIWSVVAGILFAGFLFLVIHFDAGTSLL
ncbi:MAG: hypothetical protein FD180_413 [Planctomycetota bacterium]|nr:MAG: hypothetical protein FD180_413 [Planctomycetota bacterium]